MLLKLYARAGGATNSRELKITPARSWSLRGGYQSRAKALFQVLGFGKFGSTKGFRNVAAILLAPKKVFKWYQGK